MNTKDRYRQILHLDSTPVIFHQNFVILNSKCDIFRTNWYFFDSVKRLWKVCMSAIQCISRSFRASENKKPKNRGTRAPNTNSSPLTLGYNFSESSPLTSIPYRTVTLSTCLLSKCKFLAKKRVSFAGSAQDNDTQKTAKNFRKIPYSSPMGVAGPWTHGNVGNQNTHHPYRFRWGATTGNAPKNWVKFWGTKKLPQFWGNFQTEGIGAKTWTRQTCSRVFVWITARVAELEPVEKTPKMGPVSCVCYPGMVRSEIVKNSSTWNLINR